MLHGRHSHAAGPTVVPTADEGASIERSCGGPHARCKETNLKRQDAAPTLRSRPPATKRQRGKSQSGYDSQENATQREEKEVRRDPALSAGQPRGVLAETQPQGQTANLLQPELLSTGHLPDGKRRLPGSGGTIQVALRQSA